MSEVLLTICGFLGFIAIVTLIAVMRRRFPLFDKLFSLCIKLFIVLFVIVMTAFIIFAYSFLGMIVITIDYFFLSEHHFLYAGEPVSALTDELSVVKFSVTFGILYYLSYVGSSILFLFLRVHVWVYKGLVFITTSLSIVFVYPLVMPMIFPQAYVSPKGGLLLISVVILIFIKQIIRKELREMERFSRSEDYFFRRIIPWIRTGRQPD